MNYYTKNWWYFLTEQWMHSNIAYKILVKFIWIRNMPFMTFKLDTWHFSNQGFFPEGKFPTMVWH